MAFPDDYKSQARLAMETGDYGAAIRSLTEAIASERDNITLYLGLEKHFGRGLLIPYMGVYVPITYNGNNKVIDNLTDNVVDQWTNGDIKTGFSLLAGANLKLFKVLRLGAEFNLGFEQFKNEIISPLQDKNESVKLKNLEYNTEITIGFAF